jgi:hypothetical protein
MAQVTGVALATAREAQPPAAHSTAHPRQLAERSRLLQARCLNVAAVLSKNHACSDGVSLGLQAHFTATQQPSGTSYCKELSTTL